jgi:hypothetical protein
LAASGSGKLFFQATTGDLVMREVSAENDTVLSLGVPAKNGTSLACVEWDDGNEVGTPYSHFWEDHADGMQCGQLRLFYLSTDDVLQEYAYTDGRWYEGSLAELAFESRSESSLAALKSEAMNELRLYYQLSNSSLQELSYSLNTSIAEWNLLAPEEKLPRALAGTGIGAGELGREGLRVWFQEEDYRLVEWCWGLRLESRVLENWTACMSPTPTDHFR